MNEDIIQKILQMSPRDAWEATVGPYSIREVLASFDSLEHAIAEIEWVSSFPAWRWVDRPSPEQQMAVKGLLMQHIACLYIQELQNRYDSELKEKKIR